MRDWAEHLVKAGVVGLLPDSFGSRGLGSQCGVRRRTVRSSRDRVADANAARRWPQAQAFVEPGHVTLLGWSTGANTVLWTVRRRLALADANANDADFRSAVALYPGCARPDNAGWSARMPTLILIGAADDWTLAQACRRMVAGARGRSAGTSIIVYPGADHDFDHPNRPVGLRIGVALSPASSGTVHSGANPVPAPMRSSGCRSGWRAESATALSLTLTLSLRFGSLFERDPFSRTDTACRPTMRLMHEAREQIPIPRDANLF